MSRARLSRPFRPQGWGVFFSQGIGLRPQPWAWGLPARWAGGKNRLFATTESTLADLDPLYRKSWVVYCKPPFGSPEQVLGHLARYTHRVAITNSRLVRIKGEEVTFTWKDYADHARQREMTLTGEEFLRRFLLHVLPDRFVRIRYYGLLANRHREKALALCRQVLPGPPARKIPKPAWRQQLESLTGIAPSRCEVCGRKALRLVEELMSARAPRAPPA